MAKKHFHSIWSKIEHLSPWYLLIAALVSGFICVLALRQNNLNMVKLREEVFTVDKENGDVESALRDLRKYVYSHMNTDLSSGNGIKPPIQLKYRYNRLLAKEKSRVKNSTDQVYTAAQKYCENLYPDSFSGGPRVPCIKKYVSTRTVKAQSIPDSLYKFDFVSPAWSPDLAGFSLITTIILFVLFLLRYGLEKWVKHDLANT